MTYQPPDTKYTITADDPDLSSIIYMKNNLCDFLNSLILLDNGRNINFPT